MQLQDKQQIILSDVLFISENPADYLKHLTCLHIYNQLLSRTADTSITN